MRRVVMICSLVVAASATSAFSQPLARPAQDVAKDAARKPDEMVRFAHVSPGARVIDFIPGGGYFTRVFADKVGSTGHVYADVPASLSSQKPELLSDMQTLAAQPGYGAVSVVQTFGAAGAPGSIDVVWTAQNYHDLHAFLPPEAVAAVNQAVFAALKSGGYYVIIDHVAPTGTGDATSKTLHRIEPSVVKAEVEAAGFMLDATSDVLRNPADAHDKIVFDPAIRGHTDQFALRFKKP